jgi:PadR family transcriptional regulator, regulatory protein PadR
MGDERHLTHRGLRILKLLLEDVRTPYAGSDLIQLTGIPSGNLYPLLMKFEREGLLKSTWEEMDPKVAKRPRQRFYRLTPSGIELAQRALRELSVASAVLEPRWGR